MLRYKLFSGESSQLEPEINSWLEEYDPDVTQMVQTASENGHVTISFLFEESFRGQERRLQRESGMREAGKPVISPESIPGKPLRVPEAPGHLESELQDQESGLVPPEPEP